MNETLTEKITSASEKDDLTRLNAIAAHHALSFALGKTADSLQERLAKAVKHNDLDSLERLYDALTKYKCVSYYAAWSDSEVQRALEMLEASFARLGKKVTLTIAGTPAKATRNRVKKPVQPLDLSCLEQSDLFADQNRWPRRPYCTDDLENGLIIRSLQQALTRPYVSANPPYMRVWSMFDIDRSDAANAWQVAGLPPPSWTAVNRENGYAHSVWGLTAPVLIDGLGARDAPMRYLCAIESMMREKLQADTGYAKLVTKNPAHPLWQTIRGPQMSYSLKELAEYLPGIEKYRPTKNAEKIGLGRNVTLFDTLRKWSYKSIRRYWGGGLQGWNAWMSACNSQGLVMNADLFGIDTLDGKEVWHLARSVAKWTWRHLSAEGFSQWQSQAGTKGGKASGKARAAASEDKRVSARLMASSGMSIRAIAEELKVGKSTVGDWLK